MAKARQPSQDVWGKINGSMSASQALDKPGAFQSDKPEDYKADNPKIEQCVYFGNRKMDGMSDK